jgi:RNA polymerase sigma factor (sigma-70 family)
VTPLLSTAILRTQSDERLVALARGGHERAFEALIERYRKPLLRHVRRVLPEARAEDALQQAFLNAWTALERGVEVREPRAWLYRVAQNAALNALRSPGYDYSELRESLRSPHAGPDDDHERRWVIRRTLASVAALPENQREALLRTAVEGRSQEQVAAELGLSEGAVRGLIYRARTTLRAAVTAVTPSPLVGWAVAMASGGAPGSTSERIAQVAAGGGSASAGAILAKAGAVVAVTGILATGAVTVRDQGGGRSGEDNADAESVRSHPGQPGALPTVASVTAAGHANGAAPGGHGPERHGIGSRRGSERGGNGRSPAVRDHGHLGEHGRGNPHGGRNDAADTHGKSGDESHGSPGEKHIESGGRGPDSSGSGSSGSGRDDGATTSEQSGSGSGSSGSGDGGGANSGPGGGGQTSGSGDGGSGSGSSGDGGGTTTTSDGGSGSSGPGPGTTTTRDGDSGSSGSSSSGSNDLTTVTTPTS